MKITTTQLALTAFIIAIFFAIIRVGLEILTMLIDNPSTHLTACLIYTLWMSALGIWTLAKLLRISRDIDLDLNFQERDCHFTTPSNFTSFPGRTDNIIKTAQEFTDLERRQQAIADFQDHHNVPSCPVEQNGKQLAKKIRTTRRNTQIAMDDKPNISDLAIAGLLKLKTDSDLIKSFKKATSQNSKFKSPRKPKPNT